MGLLPAAADLAACCSRLYSRCASCYCCRLLVAAARSGRCCTLACVCTAAFAGCKYNRACACAELVTQVLWLQRSCGISKCYMHIWCVQAGLAYVLLHAYVGITGVDCGSQPHAEWQLCTLMLCAQLSSKLIYTSSALMLLSCCSVCIYGCQA